MMSEIRHAMRGRSLRVAAVCAGYGGCLLDPAKDERDKAMADIGRLLGLCADIGAAGLIVVPIFGPPRINADRVDDHAIWSTMLIMSMTSPLMDRSRAPSPLPVSGS